MRNLLDDQSVIEEMEWYFLASDCAMGIRSNYSAMISPSTSNQTWVDPYSESIIKAITKRRRIERTLSRLTPHHRRVLQIMYGLNRIPPVIVDIMGGRLAGPALCTDVDMTANQFISLCLRLQMGSQREADHHEINEIRRKATALISEVQKAYRAAKRETK